MGSSKKQIEDTSVAVTRWHVKLRVAEITYLLRVGRGEI